MGPELLREMAGPKGWGRERTGQVWNVLLYQKGRKYSKDAGIMLKGHRATFKELPQAKARMIRA